jgi:CheY-like chemotaxis protein
LAIARKLVELQNGTIKAASPGVTGDPHSPSNRSRAAHRWRGIPGGRPIDERAPARRHAPPGRAHRRGSRANTGHAAHLLRRRNFVVSRLVAWQALECAEWNFGVLISDIGLPDGNGCELMIKLREKGSIQGIALTGYGMDEDIARSRAAGFVAHLTKPIRVQSLESALAIAAGATPSVSTAP